MNKALSHKPTILAVDDHPLFLHIVKKALSSSGYRLILAASGNEALRLAFASNEKIDLLLTDVNMPEINGFQLAEEFQSRYPNAVIVFMSASILPENPDAIKYIPKEYFLPKPFTVTELKNKLNVLLGMDGGEYKGKCA